VTESGPHVSDAAKNLVGQETHVQTFEPVTLRHIKEYMAGTGDWNPLHWDDEAAAASRHGRVVAPALMFQAVCREIVPESTLLPDGQHRDLGVEGIAGRTVLAGQEIELGKPLHVGDVVTLRERLLGIEEKEGRSGPLVIVTTEETYTSEPDVFVARTVTTRIFR
jgi:acyl dehydratase